MDLGFQVIHSNGTVVHPQGYKVSIMPKQSPSTPSPVKVEVDPLTSMNCDLAEGIWTGQTDFKVPITNWGSLPVMLQQGDIVAHIEEATIVTEDDYVWQSMSISTVRARLEEPSRRTVLTTNFW